MLKKSIAALAVLLAYGSAMAADTHSVTWVESKAKTGPSYSAVKVANNTSADECVEFIVSYDLSLYELHMNESQYITTKIRKKNGAGKSVQFDIAGAATPEEEKTFLAMAVAYSCKNELDEQMDFTKSSVMAVKRVDVR